MRKIKSIKQLRSEKERISHKLYDLENKMHIQWKELKQDLRPSSIIKDSIASVLKKKAEPGFQKDSFLKSTFTYGVSLLAGKLADKAGKKISTIFKK
jgi:hypothetical protein